MSNAKWVYHKEKDSSGKSLHGWKLITDGTELAIILPHQEQLAVVRTTAGLLSTTTYHDVDTPITVLQKIAEERVVEYVKKISTSLGLHEL